MQREQTNPAGGMDGILVRLTATLRDLIWNVMDHDDRVENHGQDEEHQTQGK